MGCEAKEDESMRSYSWLKLIEHRKEIDELKAQVVKLSRLLWEMKREMDKKARWSKWEEAYDWKDYK